jgi:trimethylamine--corrinoid protein Co-methyltransferase
MKHYETAFWDSELSDNEPFEKWEAAGSSDAAQRANGLWKKRLAEYEAPALDQGICDELHDFVARKKAEAADAWY